MIGSSPKCAISLRLPILFGTGLLISLAFVWLNPKVADASLQLSAPNSQNSITLEQGKPVERELKWGETHSYVVTLAAGQYLRIEIEQRGADVAFALLSSDQQKLFEFQAVEWPWRNESVPVVAQRAGSYYIQVRPLFENPPLSRYRVNIKELRAATATDNDRVAAQKYVADAYQLHRKGTQDAHREAIPKLEMALSLARKVEDQELEAKILFAFGQFHSGLHDQPKAIEYFEKALRLNRSLGERLGQARTLLRLGYSLTELGQNLQARERLQQALPLYREAGDKSGEGKALYMMAESYARESPRMALDYYLQAGPLLRAAGDINYVLELLFSSGLSWLQVGESQKAFETLNEAQLLAQRHPLVDYKANILDNLSKVHHALGDYQKALDTQYEALALRQSIGDVEASANSFHYLALVYLDLGETQRSVEFFQQAIKMRQSIGYHFRALRSQIELGRAWYQLGKYKNALGYFLSVLPMTRDYKDKFSEGRVLEGAGLTYQALGEHRKAIEFYEKALTVFRGQPWPAGEVRVILASGHAYALLNDSTKATELYRQSLALARKLNYPHVEAEALSSIARTDLKLSNLPEARASLETSLQIVESVRSRVASPALRASFLATQHSSYESYLALLMKLHRQQPAAGHAASALQVSERARARSFVETLAEAPANIRKGVDPALLNRERELRQKLSAKSAAQNRAASQSEEQTAIFSREITELTAELEQVEAQIRTASPRYAALTRPQPLSVAEIQQNIVDADSLMLEYALGEEQSFLFTITDKTFNSYELPKRSVIETTAKRYYELLTARNRTPKFEEPAQRALRIKQADKELVAAGVELSQMILRPVAAELGNRRLLIVADGALQLIPFAALPMPAHGKTKIDGRSATDPLLLNHLISYLPSATALWQLRRDLKNRQIAPKTLAVFADPVFEPDDERLPKDARDQLARERQTMSPDKDKPAAPVLAAEQLTRAIRDSGAEDERGGLGRLRYTRHEAEALLALAPQTTSLRALDFDATQKAALDPALSQYRYLHFATHGLIDNIHPELSGLVLSRFDRQGRALDGHLRLVEISNLNLPAELVVLSACKSGIGKEVRGEGLLSLTRGFMHAGAARVLVSLWDVNDKSTASLMAEFYRGLLRRQLSPSQALRAAQLRLRQSSTWASPYFWAAFVQHGEPR